MKRIALFVLLLLLVALMPCACGMVTTGEKRAKAGEIADFTPPEGFTADFSMDVGGMLMIGYNRADSNSHLFVIQAPESSGVTTEQLEQSLRDAVASNQENTAIETTTTEEIPVTIRGGGRDRHGGHGHQQRQPHRARHDCALHRQRRPGSAALPDGRGGVGPGRGGRVPGSSFR